MTAVPVDLDTHGDHPVDARLEALLAAPPGREVPDALADLLRRPSWHAHAACRGMGTDAFFPGRGDDLSPALDACSRCPVTVQCELAGRAGTEVGIWGGTSARERKRHPGAA